MKKVKAVAVFLTISAMICIGFQNCSGMGANESGVSSNAAQSQDPQATLNSAQQQVTKVMAGTLATAADLQAALLALQQLLAQIQAINTANLPASLLTLDQQLIQQLTDDINQLEAQIAALNGGGSCSFNGQPVASGASVTAYQSSSVPSGQTCQSQTRTCSSGQLSGSYTFASCTVQPPNPPPPAAVCNPGTYYFCYRTASGSNPPAFYECLISGGPGYQLDISSVQADGTFAGKACLGEPMGCAGTAFTGTCQNGQISFAYSLAGENISISGAYGLSYEVGVESSTFNGSGMVLTETVTCSSLKHCPTSHTLIGIQYP